MGFKQYWRKCPAKNLVQRGRLLPRRTRRLAAKEMWRIVGRKQDAKRIATTHGSRRE